MKIRQNTADVRIRTQVIPRVICCGKVAMGQVYVRVHRSFPFQRHFTVASYSFMHHQGEGY
jgi:hypothetical protein